MPPGLVGPGVFLYPFLRRLNMKETWKNLLKVKSIITIVLTFTFVILLAIGAAIPQEFIFIYNTVIAFYFGTQY